MDMSKLSIEEKYKVLMGPNYEEVVEKVRANGGYCICALVKNNDTRCQCKEFREMDEEGDCQCGCYTKKLRTAHEATQYLKGNKWSNQKEDEDEVEKKVADEFADRDEFEDEDTDELPDDLEYDE
jgi:hypothetical protein